MISDLFCFFSCVRGPEFRKEGRSEGGVKVEGLAADDHWFVPGVTLPLAATARACSASSGSRPGGPAGLKRTSSGIKSSFGQDRGRTRLKDKNNNNML